MSGIAVRDEVSWNESLAGQLSQFPVFMQHRILHRGTAMHRQPGVEIHITNEGQGTLLVGDRVMVQGPRHVVIMPGGVAHRLITDPTLPYRRTVICVDGLSLGIRGISSDPFAWIQQGTGFRLALPLPEYIRIQELCSRNDEEHTAARPGWEHIVLANVIEIGVLLRRLVEGLADASGRMDDPAAGQEHLVEGCCQYVRNHLDDDLTLKRVARQLATSPEHLARLFPRFMGTTYHQYVLQRRLALAQRLLRDTPEVSVTDVALTAGFQSPAHFSRIFRTYVGLPPSQFREQWQSG